MNLLPQHIQLTELTPGVAVSTIDFRLQPGYRLPAGAPPFQTMVRGGPHDELTHHSWTRAQAVACHFTVVSELAAELADLCGAASDA